MKVDLTDKYFCFKAEHLGKKYRFALKFNQKVDPSLKNKFELKDEQVFKIVKKNPGLWYKLFTGSKPRNLRKLLFRYTI